jgi:tellurium resistance protein TerZ
VSLVKGDPSKTAHALIQALGLAIPKQTQVGVTKVFLKQDVSNDLEDRRNVALTGVIIKMQTWWRMANLRAAFVEQSTNAHAIQTWWRMAHLRSRFVKQHHKAIMAQSWWRMIQARRILAKLLEKKRKEEEERRIAEEKERQRMIEKFGKEEAERLEAEKKAKEDEAKAAEADSIRAAAGAITSESDAADAEATAAAEAEKKALEEAEAAKAEKKKKKKKDDGLTRDKRGSIMMKKGMELDVPINVDGRVILGLGWTGGQWDLDASCLMFRFKQHRDDVYYYKPRSKDGSVTHKGGYAGIIRTNQQGDDAEQIEVNLSKVAPKTNAMLFVVTVFSPEGNFSSVRDAYCRLIDGVTEQEYCRYTLDKAGDETARIMCKLFRQGFSAWRLQAIGAPSEGRLYKHMISKVEPFLEDEPPKRRFKIRIHRAKLTDVKAMYKGEEKGGGLSTMVEVRFDTETKSSKLIKHCNNPQYKTAREIAGHGKIIEVNILNRVRFGRNAAATGTFMKAAHLGYVLVCVNPINLNNTTTTEQHNPRTQPKNTTKQHYQTNVLFVAYACVYD